MGEFELIRQFFMRPAHKVLLGNGDDCALVEARAGKVLAVSTDMLVAGRHFFADVPPHALGYKALAVNLSDLAAMAATPRAFTLALALPDADANWLGEFARGLFECADRYGCELIGGDTTRGPLTISITVLGDVVAASAPRRGGGQLDDDIWVSGQLGAAALALSLEQRRRNGEPVDAGVLDSLMPSLLYPTPRVALGALLGPLANAMIDLSDGLLSDLSHLLAASRCGAVIDERLVPYAPALALLEPAGKRRMALGGGDDYELCFTAAPAQRQAIAQAARKLELPLTRIGTLRSGTELELVGPDGAVLPRAALDDVSGFDHFA